MVAQENRWLSANVGTYLPLIMKLPQQVNQFLLRGQLAVHHMIRTTTSRINLSSEVLMINADVLAEEAFLSLDISAIVEHSARRRQVQGVRHFHKLVPIMPSYESYHTVELAVLEALYVHKVQRRAIGILDGIEQSLLFVGIVGGHCHQLL